MVWCIYDDNPSMIMTFHNTTPSVVVTIILLILLIYWIWLGSTKKCRITKSKHTSAEGFENIGTLVKYRNIEGDPNVPRETLFTSSGAPLSNLQELISQDRPKTFTNPSSQALAPHPLAQQMGDVRDATNSPLKKIKIHPPNFKVECADNIQNRRMYHCAIVYIRGVGPVMVANMSNFNSCYPQEEYTPSSASIDTLLGPIDPNTLLYIKGVSACGTFQNSRRIHLMTYDCPGSLGLINERPFVWNNQLWTIAITSHGKNCDPQNVLTQYSTLLQKNQQIPLTFKDGSTQLSNDSGSKEWSPFLSQGNVYFIQSVNPHRILLLSNLNEGIVEVAYTSQSPLQLSLRKAYFVMKWDQHSNLAITFTENAGRFYCFFYIFSNEPPFNIIRFGSPIDLQSYSDADTHTVFPGPVSVVGEKLLLNINSSDCGSYFLVLTKDDIF